jgi:hypothetical protein
MRSIGRAGWASHGFFGFDAQTFGNPDGATSGGGAWTGVTNQGGDGAAAGLGREIRDGGLNPNGPGQGGGGGGPAPPVPTFTQVDGGSFAGQHLVDVAILNALDIAVLLVTAANTLRQNTAASVLLMTCTNGTDNLIATSTNKGATWELSGPAFANISSAVFFAETANEFFFFDQTAALVWTSPDGATWTQHPIPENFPLTEVGVLNGDSYPIAENGLQVVANTVINSDELFHIWVSSDLVTWVNAYTDPTGLMSDPLTMRWTGSKFITGVAENDGVTVDFLTSNATGTAWTVTSNNGGDDSTPPYDFNEIGFKGLLYSGFSSADQSSVASSPDGATWTDIPITPTGAGFQTGMTATADFLFLWGHALYGANNGTTYTTILAGIPDSGVINSLNTGSGLAFAVGSNVFGGVIYRATV